MDQNTVKFFCNDFTLLVEDHAQKPTTIIVITKKVAKLAVDRNRIRRLFRPALKNLGIKGKVTIIVKKNIAEQKEDQVKTTLGKLLGKNV